MTRALPAALLAALLAAAGPASAQAGARALALERRLDAVVARDERLVHAGLGLSRALGTYARATLVGAAGANLADAPAFSARADALVRVTSDPFGEHRRAPYVGAGLTARGSRGLTGRTDLLLVVGVDGPARRNGRSAWAAEVGFGGGVRAGVALRSLRNGRR